MTQQRIVWPGKHLDLGLVTHLSDHRWNAIILQVLHQIPVDPHPIFKQQILEIQSEVEGDE